MMREGCARRVNDRDETLPAPAIRRGGAALETALGGWMRKRCARDKAWWLDLPARRPRWACNWPMAG